MTKLRATIVIDYVSEYTQTDYDEVNGEIEKRWGTALKRFARVIIVGGGALLLGLDRRVAEATQMPVHIADDPLTCVARGTGVVLQELDRMSRVLVADTYARPPR